MKKLEKFKLQDLPYKQNQYFMLEFIISR